MHGTLVAGLLFTYLMTAVVLFCWGNHRCYGEHPTRFLTFFAILFTSGLDVGLIMLPLTEFSSYQDVQSHPEYAFANPLAIAFGYWGFAVWLFYFLPCFYFCVIEPKVLFFERPVIKCINNVLIIGICAFSSSLLLRNLPWYLPQLGDGKSIIPVFYLIVFVAISLAVLSSTRIVFIKYLSLFSLLVFTSLVILFFGALLKSGVSLGDYLENTFLTGAYFSHVHHFLLPLNDYHEFYMFWWFSWSIMIGQFTARFAGGLRTWQLLLAMLVVPSLPIVLWFSVLYLVHLKGICSTGVFSLAMALVGILFVINSLDSLIRLYTESLGMTVPRLGMAKYLMVNITAMYGLTLLFLLDFLRIHWVGAVNIALQMLCLGYLLVKKRGGVWELSAFTLDCHKAPLNGRSLRREGER